MTINFGKATVHKVDGNEMAVFNKAQEFASANGKICLIGQVGEQKGRGVFGTTILTKEFLNYTREHALVSGKGSNYARVESFDTVTQRALEPPHVKEIVDYVRAKVSANEPIVFPGVVLNCDEAQATLFIRAGEARRQFAVLCIDEDAPLSLIDGMHRKHALMEVLDPKKPSDRLVGVAEQDIKNLLLSAMVTFESDRKQLRNDFAVIAQAKQISSSVQIAFRRNGINDFTTDVLKDVPFLHFHTNTAATQTGPKSAHAWILATVGRAMRVMVNGVRSDAEDKLTEKLDAHRKVTPALRDGQSFDAFVRSWWLAVQDAFPVYRDMAQTPIAPTGFMAALREQNGNENMILLNTSGLEVLAALGHDLWKHGWTSPNDIAKRASFLKSYDWKPDNAHWLTNLIPFAGASVTQKAQAVKDATSAMLKRVHDFEGRPQPAQAAA